MSPRKKEAISSFVQSENFEILSQTGFEHYSVQICIFAVHGSWRTNKYTFGFQEQYKEAWARLSLSLSGLSFLCRPLSQSWREWTYLWPACFSNESEKSHKRCSQNSGNGNASKWQIFIFSRYLRRKLWWNQRVCIFTRLLDNIVKEYWIININNGLQK